MALYWAAVCGHEAVVQLLVGKGADVEITDNYGRTALYRAVIEGCEAVMQVLIEKVADLEAKNEDFSVL
jgi:ankyrin repeat domain-containing protein 50